MRVEWRGLLIEHHVKRMRLASSGSARILPSAARLSEAWNILDAPRAHRRELFLSQSSHHRDDCLCVCECARQLERGHVDREEEEHAHCLLIICLLCLLPSAMLSARTRRSVIEEQSPGRQINWIRFSSR